MAGILDNETDPIYRARAAMAVVTRLGRLDEDEEVMMIASGNAPAAQQRLYMDLARTLAAVAVAEDVRRLVDHLTGTGPPGDGMGDE